MKFLIISGFNRTPISSREMINTAIVVHCSRRNCRLTLICEWNEITATEHRSFDFVSGNGATIGISNEQHFFISWRNITFFVSFLLARFEIYSTNVERNFCNSFVRRRGHLVPVVPSGCAIGPGTRTKPSTIIESIERRKRLTRCNWIHPYNAVSVSL